MKNLEEQKTKQYLTLRLGSFYKPWAGMQNGEGMFMKKLLLSWAEDAKQEENATQRRESSYHPWAGNKLTLAKDNVDKSYGCTIL